MKENIIVLAFLSHTSHHLQPLDKNVFGPFSYAYDQVCSEFIAERQYHLINEVTWLRLFCQAWERGNYPENIKSGFRATGIWPHNPSAVPDSACLPFDMYDHPLIDQMEISETVDAIESAGLDTSLGLLAEAAESFAPLQSEKNVFVKVVTESYNQSALQSSDDSLVPVDDVDSILHVFLQPIFKTI